VHNASRHRQLNDIHLTSILQTHFRQRLQIGLQRLVVLIVLVCLNDGNDSVVIDKSCQVVDMAIRIVADDPIAKP
jgi:hypothetical protein